MDKKIVCMAARQIDLKKQRQRTGHNDFVFVQLGYRDVNHITGFCLTAFKSDALHSELCFLSVKGFFVVRWWKVSLKVSFYNIEHGRKRF